MPNYRIHLTRWAVTALARKPMKMNHRLLPPGPRRTSPAGDANVLRIVGRRASYSVGGLRLRRSQRPLGSTIRTGDLDATASRSASPVTSTSTCAAFALASTHRSSGSLTTISDWTFGRGTTSCSLRYSSMLSTMAAGSLSFERSTFRSSRSTTSPRTNSCSARTCRSTSAHSPRVANALTRTFVSRKILTRPLGLCPRLSDTPVPLQTGVLASGVARIEATSAGVEALPERSHSASGPSVLQAGQGVGLGWDPAGW